jgi:hypothetical protein
MKLSVLSLLVVSYRLFPLSAEYANSKTDNLSVPT